MYKSGFVNIVGNPNVGKSTLMNKLVGEKLCIITSKIQTTRHRIMGILSSAEYQIVFSDTPGILQPHYKMQEIMRSFSFSAIEDADVLLYITDTEEGMKFDESFIAKVNLSEFPVLLIVNKIDLSNQEKISEIFDNWKKVIPRCEMMAISALSGFNTDSIVRRVVELLPEAQQYFPDDQFTDRSERFIVSEIIREKILLYYQKEIPYSVEVVIESFKEEEEIARIHAVIFVERDSQKGIIIGDKGKAIKKLGIESRIDIESFLKKKVYLELFVKVAKDWRNETSFLRKFGYDSK